MSNTLSVAMCTYNGARFVGEQLASIAEQTRRPDEVVVCDDGSTDDTVRAVKEFAKTAPFSVHLHVNEQNVGSTRNFERAINLCEGELIALADQDDTWMKEKLARLESEFLANPRVGMVFSDAVVVDEQLRPMGFNLWSKLGFDRQMQRSIKSGRALDVLLPGWTVTGATMAFRSRFKPLILEIPGDLNMIHDGWIALVIAAVADVALIEEPLIKYRQHSAQQIGAPARAARAQRPRIKSVDALQAAMRNQNCYEELIRIGEQVEQRLESNCVDFDCDEALHRLDQRLAHLRARSQMPKNTFSRMAPVLRELFAGRYHRYSTGFRSAAKDLLREPSRSGADRQI